MNFNIKDMIYLLYGENEKVSKNKKKKHERYQQRDEKGYVVFLDGFWSKGRQNELIDNKGVGHYYVAGLAHGCNGSCSREDFMMAVELDMIDSDPVKYTKEYGIGSEFEEVKIKYAKQ